jgi:hypothetical protein
MSNIFSFGEFLSESASQDERDRLIALVEDYFNITGMLYVDDQDRVCTKGSLSLESAMADELTEFPVQFGIISGSFELIGAKNLTSLKGAPEIVGKNFILWNCVKLKSLEGGPKKVGHLLLKSSNLETLIGAPAEVITWELEKGSKVPAEEIDLYSNDDVRKAWIESGMSAKEFIQKKRGFLAKKKFGF